MTNKESVFEYLQALNCSVRQNVPLCQYTSFKTGGNASLFAEPEDTQTLGEILRYCYAMHIKPFILGNGTNLLVDDNGVDTVVLHIGKGFDEIRMVDETSFVCQAGCSVMRICRFALEHNLTGLEFAYGIPGSAGGGAYMNAGAYGGEMKDVLVRCDHINSDGTTGFYEKNDLALSYRRSAYTDSDKVITNLYFQLAKGRHEEIRDKMDELMSRRKEKQPLEYPSAGSTFKRPEGYFAGKLIEDCGLKGKRIGGAQVSEKHSGFIINADHATTSDIKALIEYVQNSVYDKFKVKLETEVKFV